MEQLNPSGRVAIVGAGAFGRFCIDAYRAAPDLTVVAVADPDPSVLSQVSLSGCQLTLTWEDIVAADDVEVVHIITPPHQRRPIVEAAVQRNKSVFCEKPPSLSLRELDEMMAAAEKQGVAFGVDYVMRHLALYRFLDAVTRAAIFGRPRTLSFVNLAQDVPPGHWFWDRSRSGGILVEHGIHFFDVYSRIFGSARSVFAQAPRREAAAATISYHAGGVASYLHEFAYPHEVERTQGILGFDLATLTVNGWIPTEVAGTTLSGAEELRAAARGFGISLVVEEGSPIRFSAQVPDRQRQYQAAIAAGMRDSVKQHRNPAHRTLVRPEEIRASLELALLAQEMVNTSAERD